MNDEWTEIPRAASFVFLPCANPACGRHLIAQDENGQPFCNIPIDDESALRLIRDLQNSLYARVVAKDEQT
jgi:hypothetical protein